MSAGVINVDVNPGGIIKAIFDGIDGLITSDEEKETLRLQAIQAAQDNRLKEWAIEAGLLTAQMEINKIEAASDSFWNSGWRPGAGWVGVSALFFATTVPFAIQTVFWAWSVIKTGVFTPPPSMDIEMVLLILGQILGIGTLRSIDKKKGTTR